ncbi:MAG: sodium:proton antiporter [Burkholderiaceae bacterium]|jgi:Na+/H+ antiporter NhaD/arsenite permease-like protein|nr:sodium:proton antiporter [Burkholderiaceae bacterium]
MLRAEIDSAVFSPWWGLPFAGLLLSIALLPGLAPRYWHRHHGKLAAAWAAALVIALIWTRGLGAALHLALHVLWADYLPFVILLSALYVISGGIYLRGNLRGSPALNTAVLAVGAVLANLMGTTGASMLLIRPLIRINDNRAHCMHVFVFFIFIVSNIGGSLTPLGDPPLFLGFLRGIDFSWTLRHLWGPTLSALGVLLALFWWIDRLYFRLDGTRPFDPTPATPGGLRLEGGFNLILLAAVIGLVMLSGVWRDAPPLTWLGLSLNRAGLLRDAGLLALIIVSLRFTPQRVRQANRFDWAPMAEVAKLFAAIFLTLAPVIEMLRMGAEGPFSAVVRALHRADGPSAPALYFWAAGLFSSFLDNAPTYLVFFNVAGGDPATLMGAHAATLAAISAGAVFMGANTYLGNAPNWMVKSIVQNHGIRMPGFLGYMLWSGAVLLPLFVVLTFMFFG